MKKKRTLLLLPAIAASLTFAGCETLQSHDCKLTPEKCNPICYKELEKFKENQILNEKNWEKFKNFNPEKYRFKRSGIRLLDNINPMLLRLAYQIKIEIVIPYIELDRTGLISTYYMFLDDVAIYQEAKKTTFDAACTHTFAYWQKKYGQQQCDRLKAAFPVIKSLSANNQLQVALARNYKTALRMLLNLKRDIKTLKKQAKTTQGILKITAASITTFAALEEILWATAYLTNHHQEKITHAAQVEKYINQFETGAI